jgi:WbqC-like protein family
MTVAAREAVRVPAPVRVAGHQPDYLPYAGFFARMLMVDRFVIVDHVQFEKKSFQSRNRVCGSAGIVLLSVPVRTAGRFHQAITDVEIAEPEGRWRARHLRSIEQSYRGTAAYERHAPFFEDLYRRPWPHLVDLNLAIIDYLCRCFGIPAPRLRTSKLRPAGVKTHLLLDLCRAADANEYVSGPGGLDYVDDAVLAAAGISSSYARYEPASYRRGGRPFIADLSAVDLLFHASDEAGRVLRASIIGPPSTRTDPAGPAAAHRTRRNDG